MDKKKKGEKLNGFFVLLTALIALLLASWIFAFGGVEKLSPSQVREVVSPSLPSTPVNETYKFIIYRNEQWGFSVEYPVGFIAEEPVQEFSQFRAYAGLPGQVPEVIEVIVDNSTTAGAEFQQAVSTAGEQGETTSKVFTTKSGETARLVKTTSILPAAPEFSSETATIFQAFFNCGQENQYAALLLVTIPQSLQQDLPVGDYVVNSFKC